MNQESSSSWKQKDEGLQMARPQFVRHKLKRPVLYAAVFAILGMVSIFQLSSLYAQPDSTQNADIYVSPILNVEITSGDIIIMSGGQIVYGISYSNSGSVQAEDIMLQISVPQFTTFVPENSSEGWTCMDNGLDAVCEFNVEELAPGDSNTEIFAVRVDDPLPPEVILIECSVEISDDGLGEPSESGQLTDTDIVPVFGLGIEPLPKIYLPLINQNG